MTFIERMHSWTTDNPLGAKFPMDRFNRWFWKSHEAAHVRLIQFTQMTQDHMAGLQDYLHKLLDPLSTEHVVWAMGLKYSHEAAPGIKRWEYHLFLVAPKGHEILSTLRTHLIETRRDLFVIWVKLENTEASREGFLRNRINDFTVGGDYYQNRGYTSLGRDYYPSTS